MNGPGDGDSDERRGAGAVGGPIAAKKLRVIPGYFAPAYGSGTLSGKLRKSGIT